MCAAPLFKPGRGPVKQEHAGFLPRVVLRSTGQLSEHEKAGAEQSRLSEQSNPLRRESLSQLPQPLLVALFKLVLPGPFVGSDSFGHVLLSVSPWT